MIRPHALLLLGVLMGTELSATPLDAATESRWRAGLRQLADTAAVCVSRRDTVHAVFNGCIDWHSSVHGHWALLRAARVLGRPELAVLARDSLDPAQLAQEVDLLRQKPSFEMPYGRAWLLLLVEEYERTFLLDDRLHELGDLAAASLEQYLATHGCLAAAPEYRNGSWAYLRLLGYWRHREDRARWKTVAADAEACASTDLDFALDERSREFFSPLSNLIALQAELLDRDAFGQWLTGYGIDWHDLSPVETSASAHHLSINYARAWGLWAIWRQTGDAEALAAYTAHVEANVALHVDWRDNYFAYGHWVPQFGIYAMSGALDDERNNSGVH